MSTDVGVQVSSLAPPRRSKLHIACSDFLCLWQKSQSALIPLLLLPDPDPLSLGSGFVFYGKVRFAPALSISRGIESTIRSAPLLLLSKSNPCYALGFDLGVRGLRTLYSSQATIFLAENSSLLTHSVAPPFKPYPLRWAPGSIFNCKVHFTATPFCSMKSNKPNGPLPFAAAHLANL